MRAQRIPGSLGTPQGPLEAHPSLTPALPKATGRQRRSTHGQACTSSEQPCFRRCPGAARHRRPPRPPPRPPPRGIPPPPRPPPRLPLRPRGPPPRLTLPPRGPPPRLTAPREEWLAVARPGLGLPI